MLGKILLKVLRLFVGFFMCSYGTICVINSSLGAAPWDVFHQGVSYRTGITIGTASIIVGLLIVIIDALLGEKIGIATVLNMIFIGIFMDIIAFNNMVPLPNNKVTGFVTLIIGMIFLSLGTVFYMGCGLGSGPRDGLMVALQKKTKKPVKLIRGCIELGALLVGIILGGKTGIGTIIAALSLGYIMQIVFKICKFDSSKINHKSIEDNVIGIRKHLNRENDMIEEVIEND
ncbi:YczE/YyaS/YitT family protein [Faecalimicrobium dakarense]|uniref:YczE/YyaS/YitT family protein n=1 Tax=Faecalimicrobium dakarense TaxID=1301100 RepID=UPI0005A9B652|nr:membrane protein [[Clostridium] dakarense]